MDKKTVNPIFTDSLLNYIYYSIIVSVQESTGGSYFLATLASEHVSFVSNNLKVY